MVSLEALLLLHIFFMIQFKQRDIDIHFMSRLYKTYIHKFNAPDLETSR